MRPATESDSRHGTGRSGGEPTRREILARQLAGSDQHWAKALTELREGLLGMAGELDDLEKRVRDLESRERPQVR